MKKFVKIFEKFAKKIKSDEILRFSIVRRSEVAKILRHENSSSLIEDLGRASKFCDRPHFTSLKYSENIQKICDFRSSAIQKFEKFSKYSKNLRFSFVRNSKF